MNIDNPIDFISTNKREFISAAWVHNDRVDAIAHLPNGLHEFVAENGSVAGVWDDVSEFGVLYSEFTYCPVGVELDRQLCIAAAGLRMCQVQA